MYQYTFHDYIYLHPTFPHPTPVTERNSIIRLSRRTILPRRPARRHTPTLNPWVRSIRISLNMSSTGFCHQFQSSTRFTNTHYRHTSLEACYWNRPTLIHLRLSHFGRKGRYQRQIPRECMTQALDFDRDLASAFELD